MVPRPRRRRQGRAERPTAERPHVVRRSGRGPAEILITRPRSYCSARSSPRCGRGDAARVSCPRRRRCLSRRRPAPSRVWAPGP